MTYLRKTWAIHRVNSDRPSFADAYAEAKGMPVDRAERREMEAVSNIRKATPERKAEIARELLTEPAVVDAVATHRGSALWRVSHIHQDTPCCERIRARTVQVGLHIRY